MTSRALSWMHSKWLESPKLQGMAHFATALTALFAALALAFAAYQLRTSTTQGREQALLQREIAANGSWERYMEMASSRPQFAAGLDYTSLPAEQKTAYLWFVERMLFAGEQILGFDPNDAQWKLTIQIETRVHRSYLASDDFISESFCAYTVNLRTTLIEAFPRADPLAAQLRLRHAQCNDRGYTE